MNNKNPYSTQIISTMELREAYDRGETLSIEKRKKSKYDIPVGCLVFVKTTDPYHQLYGSYASPNVNTVPNSWYPTNQNYTTAKPVWVVNPTITTGTNIKYKASNYSTSTVNSSKVTTQNLKNLYKGWLSNQSSSKKGGYSLGTTTMGGNKKKPPGWHMKNVSVSNVNISNVNIAGNYKMMQPEYHFRGYRSVEDCINKFSPVVIRQEDHYSQEQLTEAHRKTGNYPEFGKPFSGIVVDKFKPVITTEGGEKVELYPGQTLYKVLINETNCLWVESEVVAPMKPEECPLHEDYKEEEENK